jgi:putative tricarboxylic transport membrane protein
VSSSTEITPLRRLQAALPYVVVLAAGVFLYYRADNFEFEQVSGRIGPGAWPKLILALMLLTAAWGVVSSAFKAGTSAQVEDAETEAAEEMVRPPEIYPYRVWLAVGATLLYLLALPFVGFFLATVIYSFGLMYLGHFRRPLAITLLSVAIALCFMFVFMRVVYVALPLGIPPFEELSYALMAMMGVR